MAATDEDKKEGGLYLYCVIEGNTEPAGLKDIKGIGDKPLRSIPYEDMQAIVSDVDTKPRANRDNLLRHANVLEQLLKFGQMLPARFGLIADDDEDVLNNFLKPHHQEFDELLKKLHGKHEVDLKVYWDNNAVLQEVANANEQVQKLRESLVGKSPQDKSVYQQKVQLGEIVHKAVEAKRTNLKEEALNMLKSISADLKENDLQSENMVLNMAFLVPEEKQSEFTANLENLDKKYQGLLTFKVVPDAPPYNFVSERITQKAGST
jgi:hypothetical protein